MKQILKIVSSRHAVFAIFGEMDGLITNRVHASYFVEGKWNPQCTGIVQQIGFVTSYDIYDTSVREPASIVFVSRVMVEQFLERRNGNLKKKNEATFSYIWLKEKEEIV